MAPLSRTVSSLRVAILEVPMVEEQQKLYDNFKLDFTDRLKAGELEKSAPSGGRGASSTTAGSAMMMQLEVA